MALVAPTLAKAEQYASDPPRILPWHQIGNIGLKMKRGRIEYAYGDPVKTPPAGPCGAYEYQGSKGRIKVFYRCRSNGGVETPDWVTSISTQSPSYRTRDGIAVGEHIPLGPCHRIKGACVHRWKGFTYATIHSYLPDGVHTRGEWKKVVNWGGNRVIVQIWTKAGVVTDVNMGMYG